MPSHMDRAFFAPPFGPADEVAGAALVKKNMSVADFFVGWTAKNILHLFSRHARRQFLKRSMGNARTIHPPSAENDNDGHEQ